MRKLTMFLGVSLLAANAGAAECKPGDFGFYRVEPSEPTQLVVDGKTLKPDPTLLAGGASYPACFFRDENQLNEQETFLFDYLIRNDRFADHMLQHGQSSSWPEDHFKTEETRIASLSVGLFPEIDGTPKNVRVPVTRDWTLVKMPEGYKHPEVFYSLLLKKRDRFAIVYAYWADYRRRKSDLMEQKIGLREDGKDKVWNEWWAKEDEKSVAWLKSKGANKLPAPPIMRAGMAIPDTQETGVVK